jgi:glycosyltransferase involved in cell wall biosynthesis
LNHQSHQGKSQILCTIIIPVYNGVAEFVQAAIASAASCLDFANLVVVDSGSKVPVSDDWMPRHENAVLIRCEDNLGLFGNWNRAISSCKTDLLLMLCADDLVISSALEKMVRLMTLDQSVVLTSSRGETIDSQGLHMGHIGDFFEPGVYLRESAAKCLIEYFAKVNLNPFNYPSGILMRLSAFKKVGMFDTNLRHVGDLDCYFRMLGIGSLALIGEVGAKVRIHEEQTGRILGVDAVGLRELDLVVNKMPFLDDNQKRTLCRWVKGHAVIGAVSYLKQGNVEAFRVYMRRAFDTGLFRALWSGVKIVFWKIAVKRPFGRRYWASLMRKSLKVHV